MRLTPEEKLLRDIFGEWPWWHPRRIFVFIMPRRIVERYDFWRWSNR